MRRRYAALFALGVSTGLGVRELAAESGTLPSTADARQLVAALARGLTIGEPLRRGDVALFPLVARSGLREPATHIVTLSEAMRRSWVTLRERTTATGLALAIDSWADAVVFIAAGQELPGGGAAGRERRVASRDTLIRPRARGLLVPLAEEMILAPAPEGPFLGHLDAAAVCSPGLRERLQNLRSALVSFPTTCEGILIAIGPRVVRLELFPSAWLHAQMRTEAGQLESPDAGIADPAELAGPAVADADPAGRETAEAFLAEIAGLPWSPREPVDLGFELEVRTPAVDGSALFAGAALVHLSVQWLP